MTYFLISYNSSNILGCVLGTPSWGYYTNPSPPKVPNEPKYTFEPIQPCLWFQNWKWDIFSMISHTVWTLRETRALLSNMSLDVMRRGVLSDWIPRRWNMTKRCLLRAAVLCQSFFTVCNGKVIKMINNFLKTLLVFVIVIHSMVVSTYFTWILSILLTIRGNCLQARPVRIQEVKQDPQPLPIIDNMAIIRRKISIERITTLESSIKADLEYRQNVLDGLTQMCIPDNIVSKNSTFNFTSVQWYAV